MAFPRCRPCSSRRKCLWAFLSLALLFGAVQFVPYGRARSVPPTGQPFAWKAPEAERIARSACYDCHSSETRWWWAVKIAPFSWLAQSDIDEARGRLDFSNWDGRISAQGLQRALDEGMPPIQYSLFHAEARLDEARKRILLDGFKASAAAGTSSAGGTDPRAVLEARCASCHSPDRALRFRAANAGEAERMIDRMVKRGAQLTEAERGILVAYFTR